MLGTFAGKLAWFNLETGELYKLADLPSGGRVQELLFSTDGKVLAVASEVRQDGSMKVIARGISGIIANFVTAENFSADAKNECLCRASLRLKTYCV